MTAEEGVAGGCWTLEDAPWDRPIRTRRLDHTHLYQYDPEELLEGRPDCPACLSIDMRHVAGKPVLTAQGYVLETRVGGWT